MLLLFLIIHSFGCDVFPYKICSPYFINWYTKVKVSEMLLRYENCDVYLKVQCIDDHLKSLVCLKQTCVSTFSKKCVGQKLSMSALEWWLKVLNIMGSVKNWWFFILPNFTLWFYIVYKYICVQVWREAGWARSYTY